jgi:hypothetical protein
MVSQAFGVLGEAIGVECFDRADNVRVQHTPSLVQEAAVSDLVRQGVLERVFDIWKQPRLVEELGGLQAAKPTA